MVAGKSFLFTLLAAITCLTVGDKAFAATVSANSYFRPPSEVIPKKLLAAGIEQVGELSIPKLIQQLDAVQWKMFSAGYVSGDGGRRTFAIYLVEQKTVVVNTLEIPNVKDGYLSTLTLHEALGALGYLDDNYQLSLGLWLIEEAHSNAAERPNLTLVESEFTHLGHENKTPVFPERLAEGGATSIGGGGDRVAMEAKIAQIAVLQLKWDAACELVPLLHKHTKGQWYYKILQTDVEESLDLSAKDVTETTNDQGLPVIMVPTLDWDFGGVNEESRLSVEALKTLTALA